MPHPRTEKADVEHPRSYYFERETVENIEELQRRLSARDGLRCTKTDAIRWAVNEAVTKLRLEQGQ